MDIRLANAALRDCFLLFRVLEGGIVDGELVGPGVRAVVAQDVGVVRAGDSRFDLELALSGGCQGACHQARREDLLHLI